MECEVVWCGSPRPRELGHRSSRIHTDSAIDLISELDVRYFPQKRAISLKSLRRIIASAFVVLCCSSAFAQHFSQPASAKKSLQRWRESKWVTLRDDFSELARYREANAALRRPAPSENRVVFFGDSITDMWKLEEYFPGKPYLNRGISGQTTPQMLVRFRQDVINLQPKALVILAGTNDIAGNTGPMLLEDIEANYSSMADLARANRITVVFSSVLPVHNYTPQSQDLFVQRPLEKILQLNRWLKDYCATNGLIYLDYFNAMVDEKGLLKRDLADDGLHPNKAGYAIMAPLAEKAIGRALASRP
jgi:lysophospholipase L1-like esterase